MSYKAIVIDQYSVNELDSATIEREWFKEYYIPEGKKIKRVVINDILYIIGKDSDETAGLLIVNIQEGGVFFGASDFEMRFERILRVALRHFNRNISVPGAWQPFHFDSCLSIFAEHSKKQRDFRIYFDQSPLGDSGNIYAYGASDDNIFQRDIYLDLYKESIEGVVDAFLSDNTSLPQVGNFGILLSQEIKRNLTNNWSLEKWLKGGLNPEQMNFVEKKCIQPIRLRGIAGTGKTQAMVIKCLVELYAAAEERPRNKTFAFLTHSSALAHTVVRGMLYALDPSGRWDTLKTEDGRPMLWIGTIYELAQEQLNYAQKGLRPLSLDGIEGKDLQKIGIKDSIEDALKDTRISNDILKEETNFKELLKRDEKDGIISEIANEFSSVIESENIKIGTESGDSYIKGKRHVWQMDLNSENKRRCILEIHKIYRDKLKKEKFMSMDQMIFDYTKYLPFNEWDQLRDVLGYDLIFVDEYHYFSNLETMCFHYLFKSRAQKNNKWPLIMAYDLKQSTNDGAIVRGIEKFKNPGIGASISVDLHMNYRSTPQITAFLQDLDGAFPAMDLEGEYKAYVSNSNCLDGKFPLLKKFNNNIDLLDSVFKNAESISRRNNEQIIAILCLNDSIFEKYLQASRVTGKYIEISSRDDIRNVNKRKGKPIFSMPEYVAGLQFDSVFIINVDQGDIDTYFISEGAKRRYLSRLYLGASRAKQNLYLSSSEERGGSSELLNGPIENGTLLVE